MDMPTQIVSEYVKNKGINLTRLAKATGLSYVSVYDSLANKNRERDLKAGELIRICNFLGLNPMDFADEQQKN